MTNHNPRLDILKEYPGAPLCPGCGLPGQVVPEEEFYGRTYSEPGTMVWVCSECLTRVGCHPGTASPLGTMADEKTRRRRIDAHMAFDALWSRDWRKNGKMSRTAAYRWLASEMDLEEIHIGELGIEDCERVIRASISLERAHGGG